MLPLVIIFGVAGGVVGLARWLITMGEDQSRIRGKLFEETLFTWFLPTLIIFAFTAWGLTDSVAPRTALVAPSGEVAAVFPDFASLWAWDSRIKLARISYDAQAVSTEMRPSAPITENPKVRNLTYEVKVEVFGTVDDLVRFLELTGNVDVNQWLRRHLYDFNELRSREIAGFYNPLDEDQQARFQELVRQFLDPYLVDSGVRFKSAQFSLP